MEAFKQNWKRTVGSAVIALVTIFVLIQLIPVDKTNPAVVSEPNWDAPRTRELAKTACFDCHSNETTWPWYAKLAPSSWLLYRDVQSGRDTLNFSDWQHSSMETGEMADVINGGGMPPWYYTLLHSNVKLSDQEKQDLINGLTATLGQSPGGGGGGEGG